MSNGGTSDVNHPGRYGRRYNEGDGTLPRYFMFYPTSDIDAFATLAAKPWPEHPGGTSDWFNSILDQYRDSWRNTCQLLGQIGGGTGGVALSVIMPMGENLKSIAVVQELLADLIKIPEVIAARLGETLPEIEPNRPPLSAADPNVAVLVVEGFNRARLARRLVQILDLLNAKGVDTDKATYGLYNLAYELRHEALDDLEAFDGHARRW
ncbi:hypothetical protein [Celeribacter sp.]|uniref:hypothetical protein n=1 Tax=Celeribacter sp. TaxID=1890673 RepID=UPI003A914F67